MARLNHEIGSPPISDDDHPTGLEEQIPSGEGGECAKLLGVDLCNLRYDIQYYIMLVTRHYVVI